MTLRQATEADLPEIARIHVETWRSTYRGLVPQGYLDSLSVEAKVEMWRRSLGSQHSSKSLIVADDPTGIAGFVIYGPDRTAPKLGEIYALYVSDNFQRKGVGAMLFDHARLSLRSRGFTMLRLWVLEGNAKGRKFYEKMGGRCNNRKLLEIDNVMLDEIQFEFLL